MHHEIAPYDVMHAIGVATRSITYVAGALGVTYTQARRVAEFCQSCGFIEIQGRHLRATDAGRTLYLKLREVPTPYYRDPRLELADQVCLFVDLYPTESLAVCASLLRADYLKVVRAAKASGFVQFRKTGPYGKCWALTLEGEQRASRLKHELSKRDRR